MTDSTVQPKVGRASLLPMAFLGLTFTTGLIDAVSYLGLGHVFTANMTGNVVFLAFALAGTPGLSVPRSVTSLLCFLLGAVIGGALTTRHAQDDYTRLAGKGQVIEGTLLTIAAVIAGVVDPQRSGPSVVYVLIALTALAMGARNAVVRKIALPDLTTTVLTLTVTGLASESTLAGSNNPRWKTRLASIITMFLGAVTGAILLRKGLVIPLCATSVIAFGLFARISIQTA